VRRGTEDRSYTTETSNTNHRPPFSPTTNGHPRSQFNSPYHPPTPAPLPAGARPTSPRNLAPQSSYPVNEYNPTPRDKSTKNSYYDPTSDSSERRRPSETAGWSEAQQHTPQVKKIMRVTSLPIKANLFSESRTIHLPIDFYGPSAILQRSIHIPCIRELSSAITYLACSSSTSIIDIALTEDGFDDVSRAATQWGNNGRASHQE